MTQSRLLLSSLLVTLTAVTFVALPATARAEHRSYCYRGECHGFHGEAHVIRSLEFMDQAALAGCEAERVSAVLAAKQEVVQALNEFCSRPAKEDLLNGLRALNRYLAFRGQWDLDEAARAVTRSLNHELRVHGTARPVVPSVPAVPAFEPFPVRPGKSYCFRGECLKFHGEEHAIEALRWMDAVLLADCRRERQEALEQVRCELLKARGEFCNYPARRELTIALRNVDTFAATGDLCHLDAAAEAVNRALDLERAEHVPVRLGRGRHRHLGAAPGWHHGEGASLTLGGGSVRFRIGF